MRTEVETRRLRTWDHDATHIPQRPWRIILKFGYLRMSRAWALVGIGIVVAVIEILMLAVMARGIANVNDAPTPEGVMAYVFTFIAFGVVALVLIGSPLFADDLRFNAPLFYFSRPLRPDDYLRGKAMQMASLLVVFTLLPTVVLVLLGLTLGSAGGSPTDYSGTALRGADLANFYASHVAGFSDWLYTGFVLVVGAAVVMAFLTAIVLCASAYTRRGWHAGMAALAVIGGTGLIGASATLGAKGAYQLLFGPFGWIGLVLERPITIHFRFQGDWQNLPGTYNGAQWAIPVAYVLLITATALAFGATVRRLRRVEALL